MSRGAASEQRSRDTGTIDPDELAAQLDQHRVQLTAYCYRMLGSAFEAEDAVQETLLRAWRSREGFEGRSSLPTWLHRIATNVCLDMLSGAQRRARPMDLTPAGTADNPLGSPREESAWVLPVPDGRVLAATSDPAEAAVARDSIRLAFVAALQLLPPRQRAVLILSEVLDWKAAEVATLLATTVAAVNSALQRARNVLATARAAAREDSADMDERTTELLARYVEAFEEYDMDRLTSLLQEDATWSMPPYPLWLQSHEDIHEFCMGPGIGCSGSVLVPVAANGAPAFGQYKPADDGGYEPWALQVLEISSEGIGGVCFFLDTQRLFPLFGLPARLGEDGVGLAKKRRQAQQLHERL